MTGDVNVEARVRPWTVLSTAERLDHRLGDLEMQGLTVVGSLARLN